MSVKHIWSTMGNLRWDELTFPSPLCKISTVKYEGVISHWLVTYCAREDHSFGSPEPTEMPS